MGTVIVKIKIMPNSPKTNLEKIKKEIEKTIKEYLSKYPPKHSFKSEIQTQEEPIAFGIKALIVTFTWPEEFSTDQLEQSLKSIKEVSSLDIIDFKRAFG